MRVLLLSLALSCLLLTPPAVAQMADKYRHLSPATNEMTEVLSQSPAPDGAALLKAASQGCRALGMLLEDKAFRDDLRRLGKASAVPAKERTAWRRALDLFTLQFLGVEEKWLRDAGLDPRATRGILDAAGQLRGSIDGPVKPDQVLEAIGSLRSEICEGARKLQARDDKARQWALARKWGYRLGGVAVIVVDVAFFPVDAPVAVGSAAIGAGMMGWSD